MSSNKGKIIGFCCNYALGVSVNALKEGGLVPENMECRLLPCTGRLEVSSLLDALRDGAEAVFVIGCDPGGCHNINGSKMAAKRVKYVKGVLEELAIEPERVEMFFSPRGEAEPVVKAVQEMDERLNEMGPLHKSS